MVENEPKPHRFDEEQIDATARRIERFRGDFTSHIDRVGSERDRSTVSFIGSASAEFRRQCDRWLTDADDFADVLGELAHWLDTVNADYSAARSASRSMFPG